MRSVELFARYFVLMGLWILLSGCAPSAESRLDEQKDPNFLAGRRRLEGMDYPGAAECFERAIDANPRSASAHYELGMICYEHTKEWAAAVYHFDRFLKIDPKSHRADSAKMLISASKQELVKELPLTGLGDSVQREIAKLGSENNALRQQVEQLQAQLKIQMAQRAVAAPPVSDLRTGAVAQAQQSLPSRDVPAVDRPAPASSRETSPTPSAARTYQVKAGDTPMKIAKANGVALASLLNANPGIEPRRMKPGQTLSLPAR